ncbi:MAG: GH36-type glycosyl hydrolase domain-containing protein [Halothermotrichaceae bacterium]
MNKYGYFNDKGDEYIVTRYDTPLPWTNYLTNGDYAAIVSSTGGGFSFYKSHHANMVLRREQRNLITDRPGRYLYIRDNDTGEYWTVNVMPVKEEEDSFKAIHGIGYTRIESETNGIAGSMHFFVPVGFDGEIARIKLKNNSDHERNLTIYFYEELQLGNFYFNEHERSISSMFQEVKVKKNKIVGRYKLWSSSREPGDNFKSPNTWAYNVFVTSIKDADGFETSQEKFIGIHREVNEPKAVENGFMSGEDNLGRPAVAALSWDIKLKAGENFENDIITGICESGKIEQSIEKVSSSQKIDLLKKNTEDYWENYISNISIKTEDPDINRHFNYWNKYQLFMNYSFGRAPSYYHLEQSMGMRDSFQDAFGMIPINSEKAREQLLRVAGFIFSDGSPCDVTSRIEYKAEKGIKVDVPVWMALTSCNYIKETGEWEVLDEIVPYLDGGEGTLYEHILKAIERLSVKPGIHGLPLFGGGDWNDSLNRLGEKGKGESTWLAQFIYYSIKEIKPLLEYKNDNEKLRFFEEIAEKMKENHEKHCWDGQWYIIGYNDNHQAVGTKNDRVGNVYLNTQTWAVISGIGDEERLEKAMDAVDEHLETEYGLSLVSPAYDRLDENIGVSSAFAAGMKENGAVFSHASAFNLLAKAELGRGDDLYRVYKKLLPSSKNPDKYMVEPYIYSQFAVGPDSPDFGRGGYHWMTGTAAWMFRIVLDYMLGIRAEYNGLLIAPCLPSKWGEFSITRPFRGDLYDISVSNPEGVQKGVKSIKVDGEIIEGSLIKPFMDGKKHQVEVVMGK